jgi:lipoprotein-releasing system permease protein
MRFALLLASRLTFQSYRSISRLAVVLSVVSIALSLAVMLVSVSIIEGFERAVTYKILNFIGGVQVSTFTAATNAETVRVRADDSLLLSLPRAVGLGIRQVSPYIIRRAILKSSGTLEGIQAWGIGPNWNAAFYQESLVSGRLPVLADTAYSSEVLVSATLAQLMDIRTNDRVRMYFLENQKVRVRPVTVVGIFSTGLQELDQAVVFCDYRLLQRVLGWAPHEVEGFEIQLHPGVSDTLVAARLNDLLPYDQRALSAHDQYGEIFGWLELQHQNVYFILGLMTVVAVINMASTILILITERTKTIGLLKALGASNLQVQAVFMLNAFYLVGAGCLAGNLLGLGLLGFQDQTQVFQLDPESYFVRSVPVAWVWLQFVSINIGVAVVCTLAMFIPTLLSYQISPIRALRWR